jgi:hypothetical protein
VAALGLIVGIALLGGGERGERGPAALAVVPSPAATGRVAAPPGTRTRALQLDEPSRSGVVVTTQELIVRGRVAQDAGEVRIMLESSGGKPIASSAIDPTGHPRAGFVPFEARFQLSKPRPGGTMVLFVVAVDPDGIPIDGVRRRFTVGAVVEVLDVPVRTAAPAG